MKFRRYKPRKVLVFDWSADLAYAVGLITTDEYFIDFIRGHLDGDGSISTYTDRYNTFKKSKYVYERLWLRFISASQIHMEWLKITITKLFGVRGRLHKTKANYVGNSMYVLKYGKKESLELLSKIYYSDDLPCLMRKKSIYLNFLSKTT
jgi:hypothetical protein